MAGEKRRNPQKNRFLRPSYLVLLVSVLAFIAAQAYAGYVASSQEQETAPRLALNSWVGDLRAFHAQYARFPADLTELENLWWKPRGAKNNPQRASYTVLANGPHILLKDHYRYIYRRVADNPHVCTVWAIPAGPKREIAQTVFLVVTMDTLKHWRGAALTDEQFGLIPQTAIPTYAQMAQLGLSEQLDAQPKKRAR